MIRHQIAGIVVAYNPNTEEIYKAVLTLSAQVDSVFLVDNSDNYLSIDWAAWKIANLRVIDNHGNKGIAQALNIGIAAAGSSGATWVLTMDQDSVIPKGYVSDIVKYLECRADIGRIALVGSAYMSDFYNGTTGSDGTHEVEYLITSGNLVNIASATKIGGFREDYFIDYVDIEFCFRARDHGLKIVQHPTLSFKHELGALQKNRFLKWTFMASHHVPIRRYYMTRNRMAFYCAYFVKHKKFVLRDIFHMLKELVKVILVEKEKMRKIKAFAYGLFDAVMSRMGKTDRSF